MLWALASLAPAASCEVLCSMSPVCFGLGFEFHGSRDVRVELGCVTSHR